MRRTKRERGGGEKPRGAQGRGSREVRGNAKAKQPECKRERPAHCSRGCVRHVDVDNRGGEAQGEHELDTVDRCHYQPQAGIVTSANRRDAAFQGGWHDNESLRRNGRPEQEEESDDGRVEPHGYQDLSRRDVAIGLRGVIAARPAVCSGMSQRRSPSPRTDRLHTAFGL
eukprot:scaffold119489_cov28-Tisochrysis_lutea.AAC.1